MAQLKRNPVDWFEIPVTDMQRAMTFYAAVLEVKLERQQTGALDMAMFPLQDDTPGSSGALVRMDRWYVPSADAGPLLYFTSPSGNLDTELARVQDAGGTVLQPKKSIGQYGFVAFFLDSEGNRLALHSQE